MTHPVTFGNRPEVREHHQGRGHRAGDEHGLATNPIGQHGGERNRNQAERFEATGTSKDGASVEAVTL